MQTDDKDVTNGFKIVLRQYTYLFFSETLEDRNEWLRALIEWMKYTNGVNDIVDDGNLTAYVKSAFPIRVPYKRDPPLALKPGQPCCMGENDSGVCTIT